MWPSSEKGVNLPSAAGCKSCELAEGPADNQAAQEFGHKAGLNQGESETMDEKLITTGVTEESTGEPSTDDFARMLKDSGAMPERPPRPGEKVKCKVVGYSDDKVFVSFGGKSEGAISRAEFAGQGEGEEGVERPELPEEGGELEAYVLSVRGGEVVVSTRLTRRDQSRALIEDAFIAGMPVEGRVGKLIKGGYEVRVSGLRAFCPLSQIDLRWPKEAEEHVGKIYAFKVVEFKEKGRNIIVSRRSILEEERITRREELKKKIVVGTLVTGRVRNIQDFGAFVELGGVDGLIPVSEMAWDRVANPREVLSEGQDVTAKVIGADWEKERISLSLKALLEDPWVIAASKYKTGQRISGKVARLADFGAFVSLEPGVDGMIHVSALGVETRVKHPREVLNVGDPIEAEVLSVDIDKRRISLSMDYRLTEGLGAPPAAGQTIQGVIEKISDQGLFLRLPSGHIANIPPAELNLRKGQEVARTFGIGHEITAKVSEVAQGGRKIRMSIRDAARDREREERKEFEAFKGDDKASFGTLGDLLKARIKS